MKLYVVHYFSLLRKEDSPCWSSRSNYDFDFRTDLYSSFEDADKAVQKNKVDDVSFYDEWGFTLSYMDGGYRLEKGDSFIRCWVEEREVDEELA